MAKKKIIENEQRINLMRPDEIHAYLDKYVIGQEEAKKTLSVALYNHYKRILHNNNANSKTEIAKSNCMILGPTGSGKTEMVRIIAKAMSVPMVVFDVSTCTSSGYVGLDVEECIVSLLRECDYDIEKAQHGIIVLDEIDKIAKKGAGPSITRDVSGECVQQNFLKLVESTTASVPPAGGRKHPEQPFLYVDTTNILFICCGAFVDIENIIKSRIGTNRIGFNAPDCDPLMEGTYLKHITPEDLQSYGFIPEFIGRFPIITSVDRLTPSHLVQILKEPKNAIVKQYQELLSMDNIDLVFEDDALEQIANYAYDLDTGARGLKSVVEKIMLDIMYEAPKMAIDGTKTITITKEIVEKKWLNKV